MRTQWWASSTAVRSLPAWRRRCWLPWTWATGNEGPCGPEGYHKGSVFASQLTGPILVKNPALLKVMVQAIYYHRGETCPEIPVDQYMAEGWAITAEQLKARCQK